MSTSSGQRVSDSWLTIPNAVTLLRMLLLAPCCALILSGTTGWWPLIILALWASTDWVDGFLARRLRQVSTVGKTLDPIADRIGIGAVVLCLAIAGTLSWWAVAVVGVVDVLTLVLAGPAARRGEISVTWLGKIRTAVMFVAVVALVAVSSQVLDIEPLARLLLCVGLTLHVIAGASYVIWAQRGPR